MRIAVLSVLLLAACSRAVLDEPAPRPVPAPAPVGYGSATIAAPAKQGQQGVAPPPPAAKAEQVYPWLDDPASGVAPPDGALEDRFAPPEGFSRVTTAGGSFGAWLRRLPLARPGTPVVSYRGGVILPPDHANLGAVVAIDVGARDLQQCADSILRLHAEWLFSQGRRDMSYRAANKAPIPFARWARGERTVPEGQGFSWAQSARPDAGHASFRRWLDAVFMWANTGSLARDTQSIDERELSPGDFVVQAGAPGHAVLVLDVARAADGRRALLLGQSFMPAQSFHVLSPGRGARGPWFVVEPGAAALDTPFWAPFRWSALRRFPAT